MILYGGSSRSSDPTTQAGQLPALVFTRKRNPCVAAAGDGETGHSPPMNTLVGTPA